MTNVEMSSCTPTAEGAASPEVVVDPVLKTPPKKKDEIAPPVSPEDGSTRKSRGRRDDVMTFVSTSSKQGKNPLVKETRHDAFSESSSRAVSSRISRAQFKGGPEVVTPKMASIEPQMLTPKPQPITTDPLIIKERKILKLWAALGGLLCGAVGMFFTSELFEGIGDSRMALAFVVCVALIIIQILLMDRSLKIMEHSGALGNSHMISFGRRRSVCPTRHGTTTLGGSIATLPRSNQGDLHDTTLSGMYDDDTSTYTQRITTAGSETGSDSFSSRSHSVLKASTRTRRKQRQLDHEEYRKASVVVVGIKTRATGPGSDAFVAHLTVLMQQIVEITTKHNGTPHSLLGEKVVLSFNTATDNMSHQQAASLTSLFLTNSTHNSGHVSAGISCGKVLCGNLGCESLRNYAVCGDPVIKATTLEKLTRALKIPILADYEVRRSCIDLMTFRFADSVVSATCDSPPEHVYQLLANKAFNSKEWMYYETPYDEAAQYLLSGDYANAEAAFARYLLVSPNDDSALRLMGFAQSKTAPPYSTVLF